MSTITCPCEAGFYVPWTFGTVFACTTCRTRVRMPHTTPRISGDGDTATYRIKAHEVKR